MATMAGRVGDRLVTGARAIPRATARRVAIWAAVIAFILFPLVLPSNWANMGVRASVWMLALLSLIVLTGWVGQVSLAQGALMGVGAFTAAQFTNHLRLDFPFHALVAGAAAAIVALGIGVAALRIRGLYLAIATLAFQWMMEASFLEWGPFSGGFNGIGIRSLKIGPYDFSNDRLFFYLAWITAGLVIMLAANLRDSKTGRAWFAIRGSEIAARSLAIDVTRYKLIGFAVSGFIVGIAGSLNLNYIGTATPLDYNFTKSITYLAIAVLGGIGAIGGALIASILYVFSDQMIFGSIAALRGKIDIAAAALLMFTLVRNPGGLAATRQEIQSRLRLARERRERDRRLRGHAISSIESGSAADLEAASSEPVDATIEQPEPQERARRTSRMETAPILQVENVTVQFGGLVALAGVSMEARTGEICGLIGPNGAGKTTLFNCVNGFVAPAGGSLLFDGAGITDVPPHERARMGMARTFQIMRLFPGMTVFENLMIATHKGNDSGFLANMFMLQRSRGADDRAAEHVREILSFLGVAQYADRTVAGLPFGILRLVELGRALVTEPKLLLLDEPASGLDVSETEALAEHLLRIRKEMGHSLFLIEHDMSLVMDVSDYVYVLDFGKNLADGVPADVRGNDEVISAYLGEEAVA